jgi:pilus assembly protein CpaB
MQSKIWIPLIFSVLLGLGAAFVAMRTLKNPHPVHIATDVGVLVAAHDIDAGTEVTPADLSIVRYPIKDVPSEAFTDMNQIANRVAVVPLVKGQLAIERLLATKDSPAGLQALVPPGMRAVTMEVNEFSGLAGLLVPGSRVDIIAMLRDERTKDASARTIVQNIRVLACGRQLGGTPVANANGSSVPPIPNNVTLLATPKQAQALQLASQGGRPWLVLRGYKDDKAVNPGITSQAELRGDDDEFVKSLASLIAPHPSALVVPTVVPSAAAPATQPVQEAVVDLHPQRTVRLILGTEEQRLTFPSEPRFEEPQFGTTGNPDAVK